MLEDRNLKLDLLALLLLGLVVFLAVALFSYDPADPIGELVRPLDRLYQQDLLVYPMHVEVTNACGWSGALAADLLLNGIGWGAHRSAGLGNASSFVIATAATQQRPGE